MLSLPSCPGSTRHSALATGCRGRRMSADIQRAAGPAQWQYAGALLARRLRTVLSLFVGPCIVLTVLVSSGCALSHSGFSANRYSLNDTQVCLGVRAAKNSDNDEFKQLAVDEARRRGMSWTHCRRLIAAHDRRGAGVVALAIAGGVAAGATAAAASQGVGRASPRPIRDWQWDWDQFYNRNRQLVWACRGVQTGAFAALGKCRHLAKNDLRWPGR